jgi:beta-lactam-binding protein with PASTA domain
MKKHRKLIVVIVVFVVLLGLAAGWYFSLTSSVRTVSVCSKVDSSAPIEGGACIERKSLSIIKDTEKYSSTVNADSSVESKCALLGAVPVSNYVGGVVGSEFVGCTHDRSFKVQFINQ